MTLTANKMREIRSRSEGYFSTKRRGCDSDCDCFSSLDFNMYVEGEKVRLGKVILFVINNKA